MISLFQREVLQVWPVIRHTVAGAGAEAVAVIGLLDDCDHRHGGCQEENFPPGLGAGSSTDYVS